MKYIELILLLGSIYMFLKSRTNSVNQDERKKVMIVKIQTGLIKKALQKRKIVPVVNGRPNLGEIDLTRVSFKYVGSRTPDTATTIPWSKLVAFMEMQLKKGFLTLGTREWIAICCNSEVNRWLQQEPASNPWKMGNGGLIGFPDGLLKTKAGMSYDVALWNPAKGNEGWHLRVFDTADDQETFPNWYNYLRLAVYPLGSRG